MESNKIPCNKNTEYNNHLSLKHFFKRFNHSYNNPDFIYDLKLNRCIYISPFFKKTADRNCMEYCDNCLSFIKKMMHPSDYSIFLLEFIEFAKTEKNRDSNHWKDFMKSFSLRIKGNKSSWEIINIHTLITENDQIIGIIKKNPRIDKSNETFCKISARENEVLNLISNGDSAKVIGRKLNISENTVITHCKHLKQKLNAKNNAELIMKAVKANMI